MPIEPREPASSADETPTPDDPPFVGGAAWKRAALEGTTIVVAALGVAWLLRLLISQSTVRAEWTLQVLLAVAMLLSVGWQAAQRHWFWTLPVRRMLRRIPKGRTDPAAIDALADIQGGPAPLVPLIQQLLRDLRAKETEIIKLESEMRQRVANRTDALERALGTLKIQAMKDQLTGLYNRRAMDDHLGRMVELRRGDISRPLSLLMIDVDYFKPLNDTLGHAAGDDLLRDIGQIIRSSIRDSDAGFRYGGDEFAVVLDGADQAAARRLADRLTSLVDALTKPLRVAKPPRLSIGIARLTDLPNPTPKALIEQADRMLYEVKGARKRAA